MRKKSCQCWKCKKSVGSDKLVCSSPLFLIHFSTVVLPKVLVASIHRATMFRTRIFTYLLLIPKNLYFFKSWNIYYSFTLEWVSEISGPKIAAPIHTSWKIAPKKSPYLKKRSNVVSSISIIAAYKQQTGNSNDIHQNTKLKELIVKTTKHVPPCLMTDDWPDI